MDTETIIKLFNDLTNGGGLASSDAIRIIISKLEAESRYAVAKLYVDANATTTVTAQD